MSLRKLCILFVTTAALAFTTVRGAAPAAFTVKVTGHGSPVIFLPAAGCSGDVWNETVKRIEFKHECHVLMIAGFAGAPPIQAPIFETVRDQLSDYISEHHLDHPALVGHSFGGVVALDLAAKHPDQVGPLVVVDVLPFLAEAFNPRANAEYARRIAEMLRATFSDPRLFRQNATGVALQSVTSAADQKRVESWILASDPVATSAATVALYQSDRRDELKEIRSPTLVIGTAAAFKDFGTPEQIAQLYRKQYQNLKSGRIELADTKSYVMLDDPSYFIRRLREILREQGDEDVNLDSFH